MADFVFRGFRVEDVFSNPVGAAAAAAVLAGAQLPPRVASSLVAAAVRGAVQGAATLAAPQLPALLGTLQAAVHLLGTAAVPQALRALRSSGRPELARRMQRLSKARNGIAHPDTTLLDDLREFALSSGPRSGCEAASCAEEAPDTDGSVKTTTRGSQHLGFSPVASDSVGSVVDLPGSVCHEEDNF